MDVQATMQLRGKFTCHICISGQQLVVGSQQEAGMLLLIWRLCWALQFVNLEQLQALIDCDEAVSKRRAAACTNMLLDSRQWAKHVLCMQGQWVDQPSKALQDSTLNDNSCSAVVTIGMRVLTCVAGWLLCWLLTHTQDGGGSAACQTQ